VIPAGSETCGNSIDDNCNNQVDEACDGGACNPVGTWRIDGGAIQYQCCDDVFFGGGFQVVLDINRFDISPATTARPFPAQPGSTLTSSTAPVCPGGAFTYRRVIPGGSLGCTETYTLTGTFTSNNRFVGNYSASFSGPQCVGSALCGGFDCLDQSWPIEVYR
jgi:hypothetical protein